MNIFVWKSAFLFVKRNTKKSHTFVNIAVESFDIVQEISAIQKENLLSGKMDSRTTQLNERYRQSYRENFINFMNTSRTQ